METLNNITFWQSCTKVVTCLLLLATLSACNHQSNNLHKLKQPKQDVHGKTLNFAKLKGKWVVVNYWAPWCKPCLHEIPELNKLQQTYHNQLQVIGVSFDTLSKQKIQHYAKAHHVHYAMVASLPIQQLGIEHVKALPATFLFNPQGKRFKTIYGEVTQTKIEKVVFSAKTS